MKALSTDVVNDWLPDLIAGDEKAYKLFFELYHQKVYKFSYRYLQNQVAAEDVGQDVSIKIWQEKSKLKTGFYT